MNPFEGVEFDWMPIIGPLVILIVTMFAIAFIYRIFFKWLPNGLYNFLIGPVCLIGLYLWFVPMNVGFYELFK
ncbi:hypothetical protein [Sporosarcina sp. FSL K6-1508]|uniref:hypothetical protein n=1 Tax=Sporosarcina sp. FSL K6-1508 TaxID=2921553 RepID=UPI0030FBCF93